jgi:hypothetical protein
MAAMNNGGKPFAPPWIGQAARPVDGEQSEQPLSEQLQQSEQSDQSEESEQSEQSEQFEQSEQSEQSEQPEEEVLESSNDNESGDIETSGATVDEESLKKHH